MIDIATVEKIHAILIERFGGKAGIRDKGLLESAMHRPFATFGETELYPEPVDKAAAVLESVLINHPFVDGNKRTAYVLARLILMENGYDINASQNEKYDFVISVTKGEIRFEEIKKWLSAHIIKQK